MAEPRADRLYLAVDCSTTAAKALLFDRRGRSVGFARRPLELARPHPGWHEQDAEQWWVASRDAMSEVIAELDDPDRIAALCITHQRESFVCLDADDRPLRPAVLWMDTRAAAQIARFGSPLIARRSGKPPDVTPAIYKLAWLREHEPDVLRAAARVGDVGAFLTRRLTGRWATGEGSADALGLLDLERLAWDPELLGIAGLRRDQLPDIVPAGELLALLSDEVAHGLGLRRAVPLVAGTGDGQAAGLGAHAAGAGRAYLNLGTSMVTGVTSTRYVTDPAFRTLAAPVHGDVVLETLLNSAGYLIEWYGREIGDPAAADDAAAHVPPGCDGLLTLPYWNAVQSPHWDPAARGATVGWHAGHTAAHLYRSLLEGVAYELRLQLEGLERSTEHAVTTLLTVGGGSGSRLWLQIVADVTGRTVRVGDEAQMSAKGAAVLAHAYVNGTGNGGIATAAADLVGPSVAVAPDPATRAAYDQAYAVHRTLYERLAPVFSALAGSVPGSTRANG